MCMFHCPMVLLRKYEDFPTVERDTSGCSHRWEHLVVAKSVWALGFHLHYTSIPSNVQRQLSQEIWALYWVKLPINTIQEYMVEHFQLSTESNCRIGFTLLLSVIGPENSRHSFNQSEVKLKTIITWSPAFSRFK